MKTLLIARDLLVASICIVAIFFILQLFGVLGSEAHADVMAEKWTPPEWAIPVEVLPSPKLEGQLDCPPTALKTWIERFNSTKHVVVIVLAFLLGRFVFWPAISAVVRRVRSPRLSVPAMKWQTRLRIFTQVMWWLFTASVFFAGLVDRAAFWKVIVVSIVLGVAGHAIVNGVTWVLGDHFWRVR